MSRTSYANEEVSFVCILLLVTYKKCKPTISIMRPVVNFSILSWIVKLKNTFHVGPRGKKYFHGNKLHRSLYICRSICHCGSGWFTWKRSLYCRGKTNSFNAYNDKLHSRKHRRCRCNHSSVLLSRGTVAVCSGPSSKKRLWKFSLQVCHYAPNCWCNFVSVWPKFDTDIHLLQPMNTKLRLRKKQLYLAVSLIWIFSIAFVLPLFVEQKYVDEVKSCHMDWKPPVSKAYWGSLAGLTLLSWLVMFVFYFRIVSGILRGDILSSSPNQGENVKEKDIQSKKKIVKLLITITVLFIVCFLPFALVSAINVSSHSLFYKVSYFLVYCSCSLNPVVYAFQSSNYRTGIRCLCAKRQTMHMVNSGNDVLTR